jgi:glutamyl-tRNA synthetase
VEDWLDGITHVIRGQDHVPNTPKQLHILAALGAELPTYAHVPFVHGPGGGKLSKRHGAITVDEFRAQGYLPDALVNYLALLGWSYDDRTEIMSRQELVERFTLERVGSSPATFDYVKLTDLNGKYLRALTPDQYADTLVADLLRDGAILPQAAETLAQVEPFDAGNIETALRQLAERLGLKPRQAFQPIRVALTGSNVSPGLFESLELLGKEESLARIAPGSGRGGASGSNAR